MEFDEKSGVVTVQLQVLLSLYFSLALAVFLSVVCVCWHVFAVLRFHTSTRPFLHRHTHSTHTHMHILIHTHTHTKTHTPHLRTKHHAPHATHTHVLALFIFWNAKVYTGCCSLY